MIDFWRSCGFHCLKRDRDGRLAVTDDFLRGYFLCRELQPVPESCADELALHQALMRNPRLEVNEEELAKIADADARENYRVMLRFRERLLAAPSLEACYTAIFQDRNTTVPPLFIDQMVQVILRHVLGEKPEPLAVRAELAGQPVFLGMAMNADSLLRLKPQNLLTNLPLARRT